VHARSSKIRALFADGNDANVVVCCYQQEHGIVLHTAILFHSSFIFTMMYSIAFYVPASHLEKVKTALFQAGAGRIGHYDCCAWQTLGQGQFRPLPGSQPFSGIQGQLESCEEYKVEMVCSPGAIDAAIAALRNAHPYEEPAYGISRLETLSCFSTPISP